MDYTYTVNINGYSFDHGLSKSMAVGLKELLMDIFVGSEVLIIKEL